MELRAASTTPSESKYRFVRKIAEGGMGVVELVVREEGSFRRVYAVKRLRKQYREDTDVRAMFVEEARIAGLIHHPNVVSVIDTGQDAQGPFLVMDFVEGVSLSRIAKHVSEKGARCPLQIAVRIVRQVAEGLHAAHELKGHDGTPLELVHRDVSPQNVIVGFDGLVRLTDFGIAKAIGRSTKTSTGLVKGKFGYLSPEQLQFEDLDRRSDLFSLGVVFYELLAGARLYGGKNAPAAARRILKEPPPDIGEVRDDVPPVIVELLMEMLTKDPALRPATAGLIERRLEAALPQTLLDEEPIRLVDWVNEAFSDYRKEQRHELELLTRFDRNKPVPRVTPSGLNEASTEVTKVQTSTSARPAARATVRRNLLLGAVIATLGAAAGAFVAFTAIERPADESSSPLVQDEVSNDHLVAATGGNGAARPLAVVPEAAEPPEAAATVRTPQPEDAESIPSIPEPVGRPSSSGATAEPNPDPVPRVRRSRRNRAAGRRSKRTPRGRTSSTASDLHLMTWDD